MRVTDKILVQAYRRDINRLAGGRGKHSGNCRPRSSGGDGEAIPALRALPIAEVFGEYLGAYQLDTLYNVCCLGTGKRGATRVAITELDLWRNLVTEVAIVP